MSATKILLRSGPSQEIFFQALQDGSALVFVDVDGRFVVMEIMGVTMDSNDLDRQNWKFQGFHHRDNGTVSFACTGWFCFRRGHGEVYVS